MRAMKQQRQKHAPRQPNAAVHKPFRTALFAILGVALVGGAGFAMLRIGNTGITGIQGGALVRQVLHDAGFSVRSITVAGRVQTEPRELLGALNISKNDSILHIDLKAVHDRIAALPWVQEVRVSRNLPNAVHVELIERHPVAIWQRNAKMVLVDRSGVEITEKDVPEYSDLPLIVGKGAPKAASELIALLASEPQLQRRVAAAVRVGERRWNLRLKDGIDVRLPERDALTAWHKLARYEESNGLLGRDVEFVDLRLANRVVVRLTQGAVRKTAEPGREAGMLVHGFVWSIG